MRALWGGASTNGNADQIDTDGELISEVTCKIAFWIIMLLKMSWIALAKLKFQ